MEREATVREGNLAEETWGNIGLHATVSVFF